MQEEEAVRVALDVDAEKVLDRAHVFHGERGAQALDEVLEQQCRGSHQDHVVHVQQEVRHLLPVVVHEEGGVGASA